MNLHLLQRRRYIYIFVPGGGTKEEALQHFGTATFHKMPGGGTATFWHCNISQNVAVPCHALQCVAVCVAVCCSMPQCVAVCCSCSSMLQCVAVCCSVLQCVVVCCSALQCVASVLHCITVCHSVSQCVTVCHSVSQCVASVLQCVAGVLQCVFTSSRAHPKRCDATPSPLTSTRTRFWQRGGRGTGGATPVSLNNTSSRAFLHNHVHTQI